MFFSNDILSQNKLNFNIHSHFMCICTFLCIVFSRGQALDAFSYQTKEALFHYEHFSIKYKTKIQLYYS